MDNSPLGKSVEELESETGNQVNSPEQGEHRRGSNDVGGMVSGAAVVPGISQVSGSVVPAIINPAAATDRAQQEQGDGTDDGRASTNRDSSET